MLLCSGSFIKTSSNPHPFKRRELPENKGYINEGHITHRAWRYLYHSLGYNYGFLMESGVWWKAPVAAWYSAKAMGVPSPSANCNLIAWLLAHCWQKKWQALLYTLSNVHSTLVPFYLDSKLLGARYLSVLCLSSTLHGGVLVCD